MSKQVPIPIKTISQYHRMLGLPKPRHPMISLSRFEDINYHPIQAPKSIVHNFYSIALKKSFYATLKYGQQEVDFDEGMLLCMAPMQVLSIEGPQEPANSHRGLLLLVHPDLLWNTHLAKKIKEYDYFDYQANEALHLSENEEQMLVGIMQSIAREYEVNIDEFSQPVIVAQLELLLTYIERFYKRQFITRKTGHHHILDEIEALLKDYFDKEDLIIKGIPTVQYLAEAVHLSPNYLSRLLKTLSGHSTQQFIQNKLVDKAKEKLSTTDLSVSEIADDLGFEQPQSFNKLFKKKTHVSPLAFRQSFN